MKKLTGLALVVLTAAPLFAGGRADSGSSGRGASGAAGRSIVVMSREEGSGTRSAFTELFGVLDADNRDNISPAAEITNSTAVMMTSVAGDPAAIGYISLGSLNDTVKALRIDGVAASLENAAGGAYRIVRPFSVAVGEDLKAPARDFINFIMSGGGQDVVEKNGCVRVPDRGPFTSAMPAGKIVAAGSSSVTPVMERLAEAYAALNPGVDIEIQQSDSSTGINAVIEGICDIGMASRELRSAETAKGIREIRIAVDGIAIIVNKDNALEGLTKEQVRSIYLGETETWNALR
ncbi:MAG: substrate-binding domain-containing protein [Treponema sp.]|jgi:phosphate transport system substrate-binding protein|nr:substrate-binding domain-containing protein [Treponema sp.]